MTPEEQSFVAPFCKAALAWEATSSLAPSVKRLLSIMAIVQAILETGWGKSWLAKAPIWNFAGIKFHDLSLGPRCPAPTKEFYSGALRGETCDFQSYTGGIAAFIADHARTLTEWECVHDALVMPNHPSAIAAVCEAVGPYTAQDREKLEARQPPAHSGYSDDPTYPYELLMIVHQLSLDDPAKVEEYAELNH
jgi:flagellum-specific peptidoglycan hydrolase FlgJ